MSVPKTPNTIEEARDPTLLEWAHRALNSGKSWAEVRKSLGLGPADQDRRWREIRRLLYKAEMPEDEESSLVDLYQKQLDHQEKMLELLKIIEDRVKAGPKDRVIERKKEYADGTKVDLEPVVIPDTDYHKFVRTNMEVLEKMMRENHDQSKAFISTRKIKVRNRSGVSIKIYSNVPRPERTAVEVLKQIEGPDDDGDAV